MLTDNQLFRFFTELKKHLANPHVIFNTTGDTVTITHLVNKSAYKYFVRRSDLQGLKSVEFGMEPREFAWILNGYKHKEQDNAN